MTKAKAPTKASGTLTIQFGLVAIPVKVYTGIEDTTLRRKQFTKDKHSVGNVKVDKDTGEVVSDITLLYEAEAGLVELTNEEIELVGGKGKTGVAEVKGFLTGPPWMLEGALFQVRPDKGAEKPFALLMAAMKAEGQSALLQYTLRERTRYGLLTYSGTLCPVRFDEEIREDRPMPDVELTTEEIEMGRTLIKALGSDIPETLTDEATARIREYAEEKAAGGEALTPVEVIETAEVDNLMAALTASVEAAKV